MTILLIDEFTTTPKVDWYLRYGLCVLESSIVMTKMKFRENIEIFSFARCSLCLNYNIHISILIKFTAFSTRKKIKIKKLITCKT
jgi:hypothetical protein